MFSSMRGGGRCEGRGIGEGAGVQGLKAWALWGWVRAAGMRGGVRVGMLRGGGGRQVGERGR